MTSVLNEYAVTFFSLMNSCSRLQAQEAIQSIANTSAALNGSQDTLNKLAKQSEGIHGIIKEVRIIKSVRKK